jgi:hypothetical protein
VIKARGATADGRTFILLGLSAENCKRLLAGQPIRVDTRRPAPDGVGLKDGPVIAIVAAATEEALAKELEPLLKELH